MEWKMLQTEDQLLKLREQSSVQPFVLFKHSTRCAISSMAKKRIENAAFPGMPDCYLLDLLANRSLSDKIAAIWGIRHESPQLLLIREDRCVYVEQHNGISVADLQEALNQ